MKTLPKQISLFTEDELTSSQVDSPANHTQWQESDLEKKMSDTSGRRCLERFEKFSRVGLWAKMFSALLIGQKGWSSTRCRLTWKLKGTKYNRMYFQLVPSTHRTEETEFGLLPTPSCMQMDYEPKEGWTWEGNYWRDQNGRKKQTDLTTSVKMNGLLPTPTAMDSTNATATMKSSQVKEGSMHSVTLCRAMAMGMLPTPTLQDARIGPNNIGGSQHRMERGSVALADIALGLTGMLPTPATRDYKGARSTEALKESGRNQTNSLPDAFAQTGKTSQLNPLFVLEMMGFPPDWTELPFLNGETNQSKPEETP
jgi:hypothetical protein